MEGVSHVARKAARSFTRPSPPLLGCKTPSPALPGPFPCPRPGSPDAHPHLPTGTTLDVVEVESYDPYTDAWTPVSPALKYVSNFSAASCGGRLYLVGSSACKYNALALQCYSPVTGGRHRRRAGRPPTPPTWLGVERRGTRAGGPSPRRPQSHLIEPEGGGPGDGGPGGREQAATGLLETATAPSETDQTAEEGGGPGGREPGVAGAGAWGLGSRVPRAGDGQPNSRSRSCLAGGSAWYRPHGPGAVARTCKSWWAPAWAPDSVPGLGLQWGSPGLGGLPGPVSPPFPPHPLDGGDDHRTHFAGWV